jgi:BirA family transcriptional regulator, biotin operon repressor / biotin---[acetyl-CoA-carboxylase] ligase
MAFTLGPKAQAAGYRVVAFETIGSTSTEALERAKAGDPGQLWVVAKAQTSGRGRRGRAWETAKGNLAASLLLRLSLPPAQIATLGFVAGLALDAAIRTCGFTSSSGTGAGHPDLGLLRVRLKWPNDVLIEGAKVAGILLQATPNGAGQSSVVIGIGVNVVHAPEGLPYPATSLAASRGTGSAEELFGALSDAWVSEQAAWEEGRGFDGIRRRWLERAAGLGASIAVRVGADVWRGVFETIDEDGMLVVRAADGSARKVAAGEVHFGAIATAGQEQHASGG